MCHGHLGSSLLQPAAKKDPQHQLGGWSRSIGQSLGLQWLTESRMGRGCTSPRWCAPPAATAASNLTPSPTSPCSCPPARPAPCPSWSWPWTALRPPTWSLCLSPSQVGTPGHSHMLRPVHVHPGHAAPGAAAVRLDAACTLSWTVVGLADQQRQMSQLPMPQASLHRRVASRRTPSLKSSCSLLLLMQAQSSRCTRRWHRCSCCPLETHEICCCWRRWVSLRAVAHGCVTNAAQRARTVCSPATQSAEACSPLHSKVLQLQIEQLGVYTPDRPGICAGAVWQYHAGLQR